MRPFFRVPRRRPPAAAPAISAGATTDVRCAGRPWGRRAPVPSRRRRAAAGGVETEEERQQAVESTICRYRRTLFSTAVILL